MKNRLFIVLLILSCILLSSLHIPEQKGREKWTNVQANQWYHKWGWMRGCDFIPSTAINQLEMWQAETFDTVTINRELGWAQNIGMNIMRVYLHHLAWQVDSFGFKKRMDKYLSIANRHGIFTVFVFFDDCWNPNYHAGKQPDPKPGIHNSGWVRDPGDRLFISPRLMDTLEWYVKDVMRTFSKDRRIALWDLYNEPGNSGYNNRSMPLLKAVFAWAHEINPSQPVSSGVWNRSLWQLNQFQVQNSDVITYHNYDEPSLHKKCIDTLRLYGLPLICTEYMARTRNSLFSNIMPMLKRENIWAINWGLVSGKTNTIFAWDSPRPDGSEPPVWFHDIFRKDGTPYKQEEVQLIRKLTSE